MCMVSIRQDYNIHVLNFTFIICRSYADLLQDSVSRTVFGAKGEIGRTEEEQKAA